VTGFASIEFGFAGAQTERARAPELLLEGFLDEGHVMEEALAGWRFLFLGYKGCGKTAIVERARLLARGDPALHVSAATLQEFSYEDFRTFAGGSGDFQSRYPPAWAWNLLLLLIESFEADEGARAAADPYYAKVVSSLEALDLMPVPKLNQLVQRTSKQQFKVGIPKFLELMGERGSESQDLQLAQMVRVLRKATLRFRSQSRHVVFLDGLDDVLTAQELQFQAISALITEAARLYLDRSEIDTAISLFNSLRTDRFTVASLSQLREALRLPPIDVNNLVSTLSISLRSR
jgi:hypothetical protein